LNGVFQTETSVVADVLGGVTYIVIAITAESVPPHPSPTLVRSLCPILVPSTHHGLRFLGLVSSEFVSDTRIRRGTSNLSVEGDDSERFARYWERVGKSEDLPNPS